MLDLGLILTLAIEQGHDPKDRKEREGAPGQTNGRLDRPEASGQHVRARRHTSSAIRHRDLVTAQPKTLALLYDETARTLDRQFDTVEGLKDRAQQILGFAAVIISVIAALDINANTAQRVLVVVDLELFGVTAVLAFAAWRFATYRDDPAVNRLYGKYRDTDVDTVRDQVIGNRFVAIEHNKRLIREKTLLIRFALWMLLGATAFLIALVALRLGQAT